MYLSAMTNPQVSLYKNDTVDSTIKENKNGSSTKKSNINSSDDDSISSQYQQVSSNTNKSLEWQNKQMNKELENDKIENKVYKNNDLIYPNPQFIPTSPSFFNNPPSKLPHPKAAPFLNPEEKDSNPMSTNSLELDPSKWDLNTTIQWLSKNQLEDFIELFSEHKIFGAMFLNLNHKVLRAYDVQSYKDRSRLLKTMRKQFTGLEKLTIKTDINDPLKLSYISKTPTTSLEPNLLNSNANSPCGKIPPSPIVDSFIEDPELEDTLENNYETVLTLNEIKEEVIMENASLEEEVNFEDELNVVDTPGLLTDKSRLEFPSINDETESLEHDDIYSIIATYADAPDSDKEIEKNDLPVSKEENSTNKIDQISDSNIITSINRIESSSSIVSDISDSIRPGLVKNNSTEMLSSPPSVSSDEITLYNSVDGLSLRSQSQPTINPRKESMINLEKNWRPNPISTNTIPNFIPQELSPRNPKRDGMLSAQRRSSLYYDSINAPYSTPGEHSSKTSKQPNLHINNMALLPSNIPAPILSPRKSSKPENITPLIVSSPTSKTYQLSSKHTNITTVASNSPTNKKNPTSPKKLNSPDSSFFSHLLPGFLNPFSKHSRKLSCPEDIKFDENKVIQVSLDTGSKYSVNIGGCTSAEEIYQKILSTVGHDSDTSYQIEEFLVDGSTRTVSPRYLMMLCSKTDNKGFVKLRLSKIAQRKYYSEGKKSLVLEPIRPIINTAPKIKTPKTSVTVPINPIQHEYQPVDMNENELPSWAKLWGERPSTDVISTNLEQFFPDHDLDKPIIDDTNDFKDEENALTQESGEGAGLGRKKSIRMIVEENQLKRMSSRNLSRRSTKLWGSRIMQIEDEGEELKKGLLKKRTLKQNTPNDKFENNMNNDISGPQAENEALASNDYPEELLMLEKRSSTRIQWIKGRMIGKGSFGKVFHALNAANGEVIAVKVIDIPSGKTMGRKRKDLIRDLYGEIELLKDLDHDNVVQYLGFEGNAKSINIFLEYVSGGSIQSVLNKEGPFEESYASSLLRQTLKGLNYLHKKDILHRDIKAANILINNEGVCKISDFGISKKSDYSVAYKCNSRMSFKGSVFWMAPEVVKDQGYSAKVDIWSVGCLLIEMLTGQRPWKELNELAAVYRLGKVSVESAPPIPNNISIDATAFLNQAFIIEPDLRPTAEDLLTHPFCARLVKK